MIANRFGIHSNFPKPTGRVDGKDRIRSIRRRLKVAKMREASSSSSEDETTSPFKDSKVPLEGIELLLNRDKVPNNLGKKMDQENLVHRDTQREKPDNSRFLKKEKHRDNSDLHSKIDDVISDAESIVRKEHPRKRLRMMRERRERRPEKVFNKQRSREDGASTTDEDSSSSVGSEISVDTNEVKRASGSDLESVSASSGSETSGSEVSESESEESESSEKEEVEQDRRWRPVSHMSREEILAEKEELLYAYGRLSDNGYRTGIRLTMKTPLETIRAEVFRLKKLRSVQRSIRFQRKMLLSFTSGLEYCNKRFNPYKFALDGWSGDVMDNIGDYDEVFEELHEKYSDTVQMAPELKLIAMVGGSGLMFHLSNTLFKSSTPQMQDILASNPHIAAQVQAAALGQMANQHANDPIFGMFMGGLGMQADRRQQQQAPTTSFSRPQASRPMRQGPTASNSSQSVGASLDEVPSGQGIMRGPEGVDDILQQLNGVEASQVGLVSDAEEEVSVKEVNTKPSRRRRVKKDDVIDIDM